MVGGGYTKAFSVAPSLLVSSIDWNGNNGMTMGDTEGENG